MYPPLSFENNMVIGKLLILNAKYVQWKIGVRYPVSVNIKIKKIIYIL